jgi:hypothetical protein
MEKFWIAWGKRYTSAPPENRMEAPRREWHSDWADMIFWYGQTPEEMLDSLLDMQARAVTLCIKVTCTNDEVKSKFNILALAKTSSFTTGKPANIATVFSTAGEELTQNHIAEWYGGAGLDHEQALTSVRNKQHLLNTAMGIDEDSFLAPSGRLGRLPQRYRNAKWGVAKGKGKKKTESAPVEQA